MGFASHYMAYSVPSIDLHVVSLRRKLHTHLVCVCTFLQNEGLYNIMLYDRISIMPEMDKVKVSDMEHLAGTNRQTPRKTSLS